MGGVVEGAALGAAFQLLFNSVMDAAHNLVPFRSQVHRLKSTLTFIKPAIDDIQTFDTIPERPQNEIRAFTDQLLKGNQLVDDCCEVRWWNVPKRCYYAKKLSNLEASLLRFFQVEVAALHYRETKRISVAVSKLGEKMNEITPILKRLEIGFTSLLNEFGEQQEDHQKETLERISAAVSKLKEQISEMATVLKTVVDSSSSYVNLNQFEQSKFPLTGISVEQGMILGS